jgi:hypothetical protein
VSRRLLIVTGAPGAGKSTALTAFLALGTERMAYDVDWLATPASGLAGRSVHTDRDTWPAYGRLWIEVLHAAFRNGRVPVLFAPFDERDVAASGLPEWAGDVAWLLLDCSDDVRAARLRARGWDRARVTEAIADAVELRRRVPDRIDTGLRTAEEVARAVAAWVDGVAGRPQAGS